MRRLAGIECNSLRAHRRTQFDELARRGEGLVIGDDDGAIALWPYGPLRTIDLRLSTVAVFSTLCTPEDFLFWRGDVKVRIARLRVRSLCER